MARAELKIPFVHHAHPEVYGRLLAALAEEPKLLARAEEAKRELAAPSHQLQALARHGPVAEKARELLGDFLPQGGSESPASQALRALEALEPFVHFLKEVGSSLKAPLVRPRADDLAAIRELAKLTERHLDLFRPAAKWLECQGLFDGEGCSLLDPPGVRFRAPTMRKFFSTPLRASEDEEYESGLEGDEAAAGAFAGGRLVVVYLVTIGPGWDEAAEEYSRHKDTYRALLSNALGAGAADTVAKDLNDFLDVTLLGGDPGRKLRRLSPGYGDWPLSDQRPLVALLKPEEDLGVRLNEGDILIPEKSTSGLMAEKRK